MDDLCKCGHGMMEHRDGIGCEDCMCDGFKWPPVSSSQENPE